MTKKYRSVVEGEECICSISAKITPSAMHIYREWRDQRLGGERISKAILNSARDREDYKNAQAEIRELQQEIAEYKQEIRMWMKSFAASNDDKWKAYNLLNQHLKPTIDEKSTP